MILFGLVNFGQRHIAAFIDFYYFNPGFSQSFFEINAILNGYSLLIQPLLELAVFYQFFSDRFPRKAASILFSLIIGSYVVALVQGIQINLRAPLAISFNLTSLPALLLGAPFGILIPLFALSARPISRRWDEMLIQSGAIPSREPPIAVWQAAMINPISGILIVGILPLIIILNPSYTGFDLSLLPLFLPLFTITVFLLFVVLRRAFLRGIRWAWIVSFSMAFSGTLIAVANLLSLFARFPLPDLESVLLFYAFFPTLGLNLLMLLLLLSEPVRNYCRIVNPY